MKRNRQKTDYKRAPKKSAIKPPNAKSKKKKNKAPSITELLRRRKNRNPLDDE